MNTENILEFSTIKETMSKMACTKWAKEEIKRLSPYLSETEVRARLRETTEARKIIELCGNPPFTALEGVDEWIELASKGGCLIPEQLEQIAGTLTAVRRLRDYLNRCKSYELTLAYYEENLDSLDDIYEEIHEKIRGGRVDDFASKQLKSLREDIERLKEKMHEKAETVMRANKDCMSDNFCTLRSGHLCIPVKKAYKYKISGSAIDKSSTGSTIFIEPAAVGKIYGELQERMLDAENEERRILYTLSALLSDKEEIIKENNRTIEKLDFIFARGKLSLECDGILPRINTERYIQLQHARHPLMEKGIAVPLDFTVGKDVNGVVITGPNTGGKTVAIKTVALNCMMAQCGLHVCCEDADICMNDAILCDIGDGQNLSENLSTFSAHITNVLEILRNVSRDSLVILDELGSGTDPAEGMGIAIAILEELKKSGALFLATTHYPEVKEYARQEENIVNARMTFDKESLKPLYQLVIGEAGESCAFHIAGRLGMPGRMLRRAARAAYGDGASHLLDELPEEKELKKSIHQKIQKQKAVYRQEEAMGFHRGDSVMVMPENKIGIICRTADEKGMLQVQMRGEKLWINHKRLRLHVASEQLYPEDYDFSIVFESVAQRKAKHEMERKYVEGAFEYQE